MSENLTGKLNNLLALLRGVDNQSLTDVVALLLSLKGEGGRSLTEVVNEIHNLGGNPAGTLHGLDARLYDLWYAVTGPSGVLAGIDAIKQDLVLLKAAIGADPYEDLELGSVRGYLAGLLSYSANGALGALPSDTDVSTTAWMDEAPSTRWAVFPEGIPGVTYNLERRVISPPAEGWGGYQFYVQTTAPTVQSTVRDYPPATWFQPDTPDSLFFAVNWQYPIRVHIRVPPAPIADYDFTTGTAGWSVITQGWQRGTYVPNTGFQPAISGWTANLWIERPIVPLTLNAAYRITYVGGGYDMSLFRGSQAAPEKLTGFHLPSSTVETTMTYSLLGGSTSYARIETGIDFVTPALTIKRVAIISLD